MLLEKCQMGLGVHNLNWNRYGYVSGKLKSTCLYIDVIDVPYLVN